jgi:hypothetical protein
MALPTMSLRASPEYHQLIRDIATALRTRPELADVLRDVLQTQDGIALRNTDVLQSILDRLAALERSIAVNAPSQPAKARSRGRARDAKGPVKSPKAIAEQTAGEGQALLTIEEARAINEMLEAGKSASEIMTTMGRPIPTREEIKQRLLEEISPPKSPPGAATGGR